jgi:hypothetical protein
MGKLQTATTLFVVRGRTPAQGVPREREHIFYPSMLQLAVGRRRKTASCQLSTMQARERGTPEEEVPEDTQNHNGKGVLFRPHHPRRLIRGGTPRQRRPTAATTGRPCSGGFTHKSKENVPAPALQQTGQSVQAPLLSSQPFDNMLKVVTVVQQIMTEVSGALSEKDEIVPITKIVRKLMNQNGH